METDTNTAKLLSTDSIVNDASNHKSDKTDPN